MGLQQDKTVLGGTGAVNGISHNRVGEKTVIFLINGLDWSGRENPDCDQMF